MTVEEILKSLKERGMKITSQRMEVIKFISEVKKGHFEVKDLFAILSRKFPSLSIVTLYNILHALSELGLVYSFSDGQKTIYDFSPEPHAHFICSVCGRIEDVELKELVIGPIKGKREKVEVVVKGICEECLKKVGS